MMAWGRGTNRVMTISEEFHEERTACAECGHNVPLDATVAAFDGRARRCADDDACHDRKEARSAFSAA